MTFPREVKDRVVEFPNRYLLVNVDTGIPLGTFDLSAVTGLITEMGTAQNKAYLQPIENELAERIKVAGLQSIEITKLWLELDLSKLGDIGFYDVFDTTDDVKNNTLHDNGVSYDNWIKSGTTTKNSDGILMINTGASNVIELPVESNGLSNSTEYTMIIEMIEDESTGSGLWIGENSDPSNSIISTKSQNYIKGIGISKLTFTTVSDITGKFLSFYSSTSNSNGERIKFRVLAIVEGNQTLETSFTSAKVNTVSTDVTFQNIGETLAIKEQEFVIAADNVDLLLYGKNQQILTLESDVNNSDTFIVTVTEPPQVNNVIFIDGVGFVTVLDVQQQA